MSQTKGASYDSNTGFRQPESSIPSGGIDHKGDREPEYRQKSADHFARQLQALVNGLEKLSQSRAEEIRDEIFKEAAKALKDWRFTPDVPGLEPERGTLQWKCKIANDVRSSRIVAGHYGVSHVSVLRYRKQYAGIRA